MIRYWSMKRYGFFIIFFLLVIVARLLPHPWNFTPIGAVGFLSAYYLKPWWVGILLSFGAMMVSDSVIGWYHLPIFVSVYVGFALYAIWGRIAHEYTTNSSRMTPPSIPPQGGRPSFSPLERGLRGVSRGVLCALLGSLTFFLLTNSAVWLFGTLYPHTLNGLVASLVAGIPFYRNMLVGDILYIGVPIGVIELLKMRSSVKIITSHLCSIWQKTTKN